MSKPANHFYEFGPFRIDVAEQVLLRDGRPVPITPKVFDTLLVLVERSGHIVDKEELMKRVWPDAFVEEGNLARHVSTLRKTLAGGSEEDQYIETVPKRGYRFIGPVNELWGDDITLTLKRHPVSQPAIREQEEKLSEGEGREEQRASASLLQRPATRVTVWAVAVLMIVLAAVISYPLILRDRGKVAGPAIRSIAVLPFKSLNPDGGDEYLGIGIAETLTTRLSSLGLLKVRPTSAVLKYAPSDQETVVVGRELGVESVLEGSIRRFGERVRVTVRLVSVPEDSLLWADKFDENFTDIFKVEDSISAKVAEALALKLSGEEQSRLTKRYTENAEAYQLYLKGRFFWNKRTQEGFKLGIEQFKQAVERDPDYALAYAGLADSYTGLTFYNFAAPHETMPKAKEAATNALAIDSTLAEAHAALAHVKVNYDWAWSDAEKEFKLSIELKPDYATAHQWYAIHYLTPTGRLDEAIQEMKQALDIEPTSLVMNTFWGATLYFAGRYDDAIEQCRKTIQLDSNFAVAHWHLGLALQQKGMFEDAIAELQKAISLSGGSPLMTAALGHAYAKAGNRSDARRILEQLEKPSAVGYVPSYELAAIYVALGESEQAFQRLEASYKERSFHLVNLKVRPEFAPLRSDPRFRDLVRRIGLPQ